MELPHRGTVPGWGMRWRRNSSTWRPASSRDVVDAATASVSPLAWCMRWTTSTMAASFSAGFVLPRSGLAVAHGVTVLNAPGLVDCGYRGELRVVLVNTDRAGDYLVRRGDRIAQLVVQRVEAATFVEVDDLPPSERGEGG